jgi:hypothetical protein
VYVNERIVQNSIFALLSVVCWITVHELLFPHILWQQASCIIKMCLINSTHEWFICLSSIWKQMLVVTTGPKSIHIFSLESFFSDLWRIFSNWVTSVMRKSGIPWMPDVEFRHCETSLMPGKSTPLSNSYFHWLQGIFWIVGLVGHNQCGHDGKDRKSLTLLGLIAPLM